MKPMRLRVGMTSFSRLSHFPVREDSALVKPVALPPGRATLATKPSPTGSDTTANTTGIVRVFLNVAAVAGCASYKQNIGLRGNEPLCIGLHLGDIVAGPAIIDLQIFALDPTQALQPPRKRDEVAFHFRVSGR